MWSSCCEVQGGVYFGKGTFGEGKTRLFPSGKAWGYYTTPHILLEETERKGQYRHVKRVDKKKKAHHLLWKVEMWWESFEKGMRGTGHQNSKYSHTLEKN